MDCQAICTSCDRDWDWCWVLRYTRESHCYQGLAATSWGHVTRAQISEPTALFTTIIVTWGEMFWLLTSSFWLCSHLVWGFDGAGGSDLGFFLPSLDGNEVISDSEVLGFVTFLAESFWRVDEVLITLDFESFWGTPGFWLIGFFLPPTTDEEGLSPEFVAVLLLTFFFSSALEAVGCKIYKF